MRDLQVSGGLPGGVNPYAGTNSVSTLTSQNSHSRINQLYFAQQ